MLAFIVVLGVLIIVHESGHFLAARLCRAEVDVFSVGFGKRLWGFKKGGTDYRLSLVPLGGYVRVPGLGPDESDAVGAAEQTVDLLPRWKRAVILLAGPLTNVAAAVLLLAVAFMAGVEVPAYRGQPAEIGWVEPDSPAAEAGAQPGDVVTRLDGTPVETWEDLETSILTTGGRTVKLTVRREGEPVQMTMTPESISRYGFGWAGVLPPLDTKVRSVLAGTPADRAGLEPGDRIVAIDGEPVHQFWDLIRLITPRPDEEVTLSVERDDRVEQVEVVPYDDGGNGKIGVGLVFPTVLQREGPLRALGSGIVGCIDMTRRTFQVLGKLVTGRASFRQTMSGPIDIARISGQAARQGLSRLVWLMGVISLQLGIFNLLPIPVLDGGHLTVLAFEAGIRRDLSPRVKERILQVGFALIIVLMAVVLYNDILKILPDSIYRLLPGASP